VALLGRDELDAAVAVTVVVPVEKRRHPQAGLLSAGEWAARVVGPVLWGCPGFVDRSIGVMP
jgi:hypothetical protein